MRPIARQGARLASQVRSASCGRARPACPPICAGHKQSRGFTSSNNRSLEPRTPDEHDAWLEKQREEQRKAEKDGVRSDQAQDADAGEAKTDSYGRKSGLRRTMRQRRMTDVPKPPPVPDWFLRHNVVLVADLMKEGGSTHRSRRIIRCVDSNTGHTLFTVPHYGAWPEERPTKRQAAKTSERVLTTVRGKELDVTTLGINAEFLGALTEKEREKMLVEALRDQREKGPDDVDLEALGELLVALPRDLQKEVYRRPETPSSSVGDDDARVKEPQLGRAKQNVDWRPKLEPHVKPTQPSISIPEISSVLGENFFDQQYPASEPASQSTAPSDVGEGEELDWQPLKQLKEPKPTQGYGPKSWIFLEAQAGVQAAFALAEKPGNISSFASSRVDISLCCPDVESHNHMNRYVAALTAAVNADVIRIDANDIEDLTAEYVGQGKDEPGSFSTVGYDIYDGYEASSSAGHSFKPFGDIADDEIKQDEQDNDDEYDEEDAVDDRSSAGPGPSSLREIIKRSPWVQDALKGLRAAGITPVGVRSGQMGSPFVQRSSKHSASPDYVKWDDERLSALLEGLLDAAQQKRAKRSASAARENGGTGDLSAHNSNLLRRWTSRFQKFRASTAETLVRQLHDTSIMTEGGIKLESKQDVSGSAGAPVTESRATIVHVPDLKDIMRSRLGEAIIKRLVRVVQKRRRMGERIIVVGTTAQENSMFSSDTQEAEDSPFRTITIAPLFKQSVRQVVEFEKFLTPAPSETLSKPAYRRILEINLRHMQSMLHRLRPACHPDLRSREARRQMSLPGTYFLSEKVLSLDQVQRTVLIALALASEQAKSDVVHPIHIALAAYVTSRADHVTQAWKSYDRAANNIFNSSGSGDSARTESAAGKGDASSKVSKIEEVKKKSDQHEKRLLTGVADSQNIKTGFADVHATPETIDALKTLTSLSLLRPEAFSYGVLANDRLPGLLLYGPPGTGKTLLAKAVAKESKATVLEVSGAQIYEKYVGEGEKMVRAVFSLAKKLSPCVVFIDEADAIFGSRSNAGNRNTHREIINQFLREWDGMDDHGVFMMVASNRPFDLDDAVLRRLPRRLLVDLPVAKDREAILRIHLKHELLESSVDLAKLAEQTPFYSGSDLKNVAVSAALAAVREENDLLAANSENADFKLPAKRTLTNKHFEKALQEISASISEDMASLSAVRKFDEQYGDRRGRRKKTAYGFGDSDGLPDESAVRVRQLETPSPAPSTPAQESAPGASSRP